MVFIQRAYRRDVMSAKLGSLSIDDGDGSEKLSIINFLPLKRGCAYLRGGLLERGRA